MSGMVHGAHGRSLMRGRPGTAKAVGAFVPQLTQKAFEKYGFSTASLLMDWAAIVGPDVAGWTRPERLKWPRDVDAFTALEDGESGRRGATLVLRVEAARALDVQYQSAQIKDRINAYFGYCAVGELRVFQAPVAACRSDNRSQPQRQDGPGEATTTAGDSELAAALARLGASVRADTLAG